MKKYVRLSEKILNDEKEGKNEKVWLKKEMKYARLSGKT